MKKRFEKIIELDGWFATIVITFLAIMVVIFNFLKKYVLKAIDLIITLFIAWLIIYIIFHTTIKASISITGGW